jgi:hypothetical protein
MLVGGCVVSLSLRVAVVGLAACCLRRRPRFCQAVGVRRNLILQGYRLQIVFSVELGSVDEANLSIVATLFAK